MWTKDVATSHTCRDCTKSSADGAKFYQAPGSGRLSIRCFDCDRPLVLARRARGATSLGNSEALATLAREGFVA